MKAAGIKMMPNQVLVQIEDDYETYQLNGRDTGILSPLTIDTTGQRVSVFGTVVKVCEKLRYLGEELKRARQNHDGDHLTKISDEIRKSSSVLDVPIEVKPGDRVIYLYKNQFDAYKIGKVLRTEDFGTCMIMDYNNLRAIVLGEDELYPLNGFVFLKEKELKTDEVSSGGIHLLDKKHMGLKFKGKKSFGEVVEVGCLINGYLDFLDFPNDDSHKMEKGDVLIFDGRMSNSLQFESHQTLKTKRVLIQRKDILAHVLDKSLFEFKEENV